MYDQFQEEDNQLTGSLILAHPHLKDSNFFRSVVLMTSHGSEGSVGVVVNKDSGVRLGQVGSQFADYDLQDVPLYVGGPVEPERIFLSAWKVVPEANEFKLYFGMEPMIAQSKRESDPELVLRAFKGYSGWSSGQLQGELNENAWVVSKMDGYAINRFDGEELWRHVIMNIDLGLGLMSMAPEVVEWN